MFTKNDVRGDVIDLPTLSRNKPALWLGFFRYALCPLCNLRVHQMVGAWPRFEGLCTFVAVFQSPASAFEGFITKHTPPFPVVADPEMDLFKSYGIESSLLKAVFHPKAMGKALEASRAGYGGKPTDPHHGAGLKIPADFIVDPTTGKLRVARYGNYLGDSIPFDDAEVVLKALNTSAT